MVCYASCWLAVWLLEVKGHAPLRGGQSWHACLTGWLRNWQFGFQGGGSGRGHTQCGFACGTAGSLLGGLCYTDPRPSMLCSACALLLGWRASVVQVFNEVFSLYHALVLDVPVRQCKVAGIAS